jgi:hypothetical protein
MSNLSKFNNINQRTFAKKCIQIKKGVRLTNASILLVMFSSFCSEVLRYSVVYLVFASLIGKQLGFETVFVSTPSLNCLILLVTSVYLILLA